mmetsp:Transcript_1725/g.4763  ORF Transcript_1725/g.4763 Transcript_1725/m.4763 type:complete len:459 (+) Transcript_1725:159-1535(+)
MRLRLLGRRLGRLGGLVLLGHGLDHTHSHGHAHVTHGEAAQGRVVLEGLHGQRALGDQVHDAAVASLHALGVLLRLLVGTAVDLGGDLGELARDVRGVAVQHRGVAGHDVLVVHHDHLGVEGLGLAGRVVLGVGAHVAAADLLHGHVLDVEADVVAGLRLGHGLVVHLHGLDLSGDHDGGEGHDHAGLEDARLHAAHGNRADAADLVHILEGQAQGLVRGALGRLDRVERVQQAGAGVPAHLVGLGDHVLALEARDGDEGDALHLVADLGQVLAHLLLDLLVAVLLVVDRVHLVHGHDHLLHAQGVRQQGVLAGLALLGDTSLELTHAGGDDEHGHVGLRGARDHVLDEVTVARGVDDRELEVRGLELPQGDVDGDTALALGLELVQHPGVLEGALAHLGGLLLELLDRALVDAAALVDQVARGRRLARVDMADHHDVDVSLLLAHCVLVFWSFAPHL